ncbi:MAG: MFS transporter [Candidatus Bathyarchaeia archaeon]
MFDSYRGLSKEAKYLIYSGILPAVAYGMFYTDISYFLTKVQGLPIDFMGLIVTAMGISTFATSIPLGIAADRYGRKNMLIAGTIIAGVIIAVFALTTDATLLIVAAIFEGISEAALSVSSGAWLAEKVDCSKRNSAFSLFAFTQSIAYGVGGVLLFGVGNFKVLGLSSHVFLYVTLGLLSLVSLAFLVTVKETTAVCAKPAGSTMKESTPKESRSILLKYVLATAIIAFGAGMVVPLMTAWLSLQYGIPDAVSGPILGITSFFIGAATLAAPAIAKKIGLVKAIVVLQASSTVFMFITPLFPNYIGASVAYTIRAFLMNMASPLSQSMIMGLVTEKQRGAASGVNAALWRLPNALSTYLGAFMMGLGFLSLPFFTAALLYLLAIGLFWKFFHKTRLPEEADG